MMTSGMSCPPEAVKCTAMMSEAVGAPLRDTVCDLLDAIFACGLSQNLTDALYNIARFIPEISSEIRERLLDLISMTLAGKLFYYPGTPAKWRRKMPNNVTVAQSSSTTTTKEETDRATALALRILGEILHCSRNRFIEHDIPLFY